MIYAVYARLFISISILSFTAVYCGDASTNPISTESATVSGLWKIGPLNKKKIKTSSSENKASDPKDLVQNAQPHSDDEEEIECSTDFRPGSSVHQFFGKLLTIAPDAEQVKLKNLFYAKPTPKAELNKRDKPDEYYKQRSLCKRKTLLHMLLHYARINERNTITLLEHRMELEKQALDHARKQIESYNNQQTLAHRQMLTATKESCTQEITENKNHYEARLLEAQNEINRADQRSLYATGIAFASIGLAALIVCTKNSNTASPSKTST